MSSERAPEGAAFAENTPALEESSSAAATCAAGSATSRERERRWVRTVAASAHEVAASAAAFWQTLSTHDLPAENAPAGLLEGCSRSALALRPYEAEVFRVASEAGLAVDVSIYRGPTDWVLMCRRSQSHSQGLARLAFVYSSLARSRDAVVFTDAAGTLLGASQQWLGLYSFSHLDVLGQNPRLINSRQHPRSFFRDLYAQLVDPEIGTWSGEIFNRGKSGDLIQVSQTITMFPDETGAVSGYLGITRDMTAHRDVRERLLRSNEELGARLRAEDELLSMTVHDLRSPLHATLGFLELAHGDVAAGAAERALLRLERAREAAERMEVLIQSLLDAQRARSGKLELALQRTWVSSLVRSEVELHRVHAARKGIAIELQQSGPALPGYFDELRLSEAISNLLANAVKFSPAGSTIRVRHAGTEAGEHEIEIDDQGPGIPLADREAVFELYFQSATKGQVTIERKGSGWGLFIAKRVVELHGGELAALDSPGGGCRMRMSFRTRAEAWSERPWAAAVLDPSEVVWRDLSATLRDRELPTLAAHSLAELTALAASELPNVIFVAAGAAGLARVAEATALPAGSPAATPLFVIEPSAEGLKLLEASGPSRLVETVRGWFAPGAEAQLFLESKE